MDFVLDDQGRVLAHHEVDGFAERVAPAKRVEELERKGVRDGLVDVDVDGFAGTGEAYFVSGFSRRSISPEQDSPLMEKLTDFLSVEMRMLSDSCDSSRIILENCPDGIETFDE